MTSETCSPTDQARTRVRRLVMIGVAVGALLLVASPAGAHPFVQGGEIAVDSSATITLDLAHGCGHGEVVEDTLEVALEVPDWLRVVEVVDRDDWVVELSHDEGRVVEVLWATDVPQEPAPQLALEVVASGEPGEQRHLRVFQGCAQSSHRWIGTPDDPADDPAVAVTLADPDPDAPPPAGDGPVEPGDAQVPPASDERDEGSWPVWLVPVAVAAVVAAVVAALRRARVGGDT